MWANRNSQNRRKNFDKHSTYNNNNNIAMNYERKCHDKFIVVGRYRFLYSGQIVDGEMDTTS